MDALNRPTQAGDIKRVFHVAIAAFVMLGIFIFLVLNSHSYDPKAFVLSGTRFSLADNLGTKGYDGQFAYYIATDPFSAHQYMDEPGKRYQRILYPIFVWILSFGGHSGIVPWSMVGVNLMAVVITTGVLAHMMMERRANPWWALFFVFYAGVLFAIRADLNEPLAMMLSLTGWYAYQRRKMKQALLCFALAGLAKEIGLIFPFAIAVWELINREWRKAITVLIVSIFPFGIWFLMLQLQWGNSTGSLIPNWLPFSGIFSVSDKAFLIVESIWVLIPMFLALVMIIFDLYKHNRVHWNLDTFLVLINIILLSYMPNQTWEDPLAVLRSAIPFVITTLIWMARSHRKLLPYATALWAPSSIILFMTPGMVF